VSNPANFTRHPQLNPQATNTQTQIPRSHQLPKMATAGHVANFTSAENEPQLPQEIAAIGPAGFPKMATNGEGTSALPLTTSNRRSAPHPVIVWTNGKGETCTRFRMSALLCARARFARGAQFAAGTQLPWKPQGTRCCNFTLATGLRAKS
jgi:hypothetical protein